VLAIFVAFVVGVIVGKMQLFVVSGKAIGTIALLLGVVFGAWIISNPQEASHWWKYYSSQWFGIPSTIQRQHRL
jgi:ABC-type lipoprotein release transport system permease subunit